MSATSRIACVICRLHGRVRGADQTRLAAATTFSAVNAEKLEQLARRRRFAEAVDADDARLRGPTYLRQKSVTPASTATRGTPRGSTDVAIAASCAVEHAGGRHRHDAHGNAFCLQAASALPSRAATSEPVAMSTACAARRPPRQARSRRARSPRSAPRRASETAGSGARTAGTSARRVRSIAATHATADLDRVARAPHVHVRESGAASPRARPAGASARLRRGRSNRA